MHFKFISKSKKNEKRIINTLTQSAIRAVGPQKKGRRRSNMNLMMRGILYYIRSGCTWDLLPKEFGPHQTVFGWYVRLCELKVFEELFQDLKSAFYRNAKNKIEKLCCDGCLVQHCRKNELTGKNPRNKNKSTLNNILTTNQKGFPLDLLICHGTAHDSIFFSTSIYNSIQNLKLEKDWSVHADKGFDSKKNRRFIRELGGIPKIPYRQLGLNKGIKNNKDSHRFVVERTFSWKNAFKNLKHLFIVKSHRIKEMTMLVMGIIYLRHFVETDFRNLRIGR